MSNRRQPPHVDGILRHESGGIGAQPGSFPRWPHGGSAATVLAGPPAPICRLLRRRVRGLWQTGACVNTGVCGPCHPTRPCTPSKFEPVRFEASVLDAGNPPLFCQQGGGGWVREGSLTSTSEKRCREFLAILGSRVG